MYISGIGAYLPEKRLLAAHAAASGEYEPDYFERDGYLSVSVEDELFPAEMALQAANAALGQAQVASADLSKVIFTAIHRHGHSRFWSPASHMQKELAAGRAIPFNLTQGCNAALIGISLARESLTAGSTDAVLVSGADRFSGSGFNRWNSDYGLIFGDAAVSVVVSNRPGFARIVHLATQSVPQLEELHRMAQPEVETAASLQTDFYVRSNKKRFLQNHGVEGFKQPILQALNRLRSDLISETDILAHPADWMIPPFVGNANRHATYDDRFGDLAHNNAWSFGREIGHTGTGDGLLGLWHLQQQGLIQAGSRVLIVSAGAGFTCSVMLLDIL